MFLDDQPKHIEALKKVLEANGDSSPEAVRKACLTIAHLSELSESYDDMCLYSATIVYEAKNSHDLTLEERSTLSVAFKNAVGARRAFWRNLISEEESVACNFLRTNVEKELERLCREIILLLETILIPHPESVVDASIFYYKMAGDYYRYLAEFITTEDTEKIHNNSSMFYGKAMSLAEETLQPTDPMRLGLALNYSVCLFEIIRDKQAACDLASKAFNEAVDQIEGLEEAAYRDSAVILQLLRDNLHLWGENTSSTE